MKNFVEIEKIHDVKVSPQMNFALHWNQIVKFCCGENKPLIPGSNLYDMFQPVKAYVIYRCLIADWKNNIVIESFDLAGITGYKVTNETYKISAISENVADALGEVFLDMKKHFMLRTEKESLLDIPEQLQEKEKTMIEANNFSCMIHNELQMGVKPIFFGSYPDLRSGAAIAIEQRKKIVSLYLYN